MARRRRLSPEERRLWEQVAASATPLRPATPPGEEPSPAPPDPPRPAPRPPIRAPKPAAARATVDLAPDPQAALARAQPQMDRRRFERLRRGRLEPEARLDLHGMTLERAHAALTAFVLDADARGLRLLLVITGKGREPGGVWPQRHGMLRHSVPHWLVAPPLAGHILQVAPAHQRHGGGGAYYVYLRRRR